MMERTTIALDKGLLKRLREEAARRDKTLGELLGEAASQYFQARKKAKSFQLTWHVEGGKRPPPVDPADRDRLHDWLDQNR